MGAALVVGSAEREQSGADRRQLTIRQLHAPIHMPDKTEAGGLRNRKWRGHHGPTGPSPPPLRTLAVSQSYSTRSPFHDTAPNAREEKSDSLSSLLGCGRLLLVVHFCFLEFASPPLCFLVLLLLLFSPQVPISLLPHFVFVLRLAVFTFSVFVVTWMCPCVCVCACVCASLWCGPV